VLSLDREHPGVGNPARHESLRGRAPPRILRGSYYGSFSGHVDPTTGDETSTFHSGDDVYTGVALGAGIGMKYGDSGRLGIDIAWRPVSDLFDDVVDVGVHLAF